MTDAPPVTASPAIERAPRRAVLFDVDGTLVDAVENQRRIWAEWAAAHRQSADEVYALALRIGLTAVTQRAEGDALRRPSKLSGRSEAPRW